MNPDGTLPAGAGMDPMTQPPVDNQPMPTRPAQSPLNQIGNYYQQFLGREADQGGLNSWMDAYNQGTSLEDIQSGIQNSQEGQNYGIGNQINRLYNENLGRNADTEGLNFWRNQMQNGMTLNDVLEQGIRPSQEYQNYQNSLRPQVDPAGAFTGGNPYGTMVPEVSQNPFAGGFGSNTNNGATGLAPGMVDPGMPNMSTPFTSSPYETDDFSNPGRGTGTPSDIFRLYGGRDLFKDKPMVDDPFQYIASQPQHVQDVFNTYLTMFQDPKIALNYALLSRTRNPDGSVV